jgi:hypothetical protein
MTLYIYLIYNIKLSGAPQRRRSFYKSIIQLLRTTKYLMIFMLIPLSRINLVVFRGGDRVFIAKGMIPLLRNEVQFSKIYVSDIILHNLGGAPQRRQSFYEWHNSAVKQLAKH